jgi:hypothetical protein
VPGAPSADWLLLHPPEVRDEAYPMGYHLLGEAPLGEWRLQTAFATERECDAARRRNIDETIDRARAEHGQAAKYELAVRRAVHARCVRRGTAE